MSAIAIETGTVLQVVVMAGGAMLVWGQLREALAEMRASNAQVREAVAELRQHRDRDQGRIGRLETAYGRLTERVASLERLMGREGERHGSEPPSGEDERG